MQRYGKGLKIKNKHSKTLFHASQTAGVDCRDSTKNNDSDPSEKESKDKNLDLNLNNLNNFNHNLSKNAEKNDNNEDLNSYPTLDAHAEPEEAINTPEKNNVNDENIDETINVPKQDSNLSSHGRSSCIHRPGERCRSFIQHMSIQIKGRNKHILISKLNIEKLFLYQMYLQRMQLK